MKNGAIFSDIPLGRHLHVASRLYFFALSSKLIELDIDRYYAILTCIVQEEEPITQQEVGRRLLIDKTSMVKIIDYLSQHGFVIRKVNPNDRRSNHIELTERARNVLPLIYQSIDLLNEEAFEGFNAEEVKLFSKMLCSVSNTLRNKLKSTYLKSEFSIDNI